LTIIWKYLSSFHTTGKWLILAAAVGIVAGIGAIAFDALGQVIRNIALERIAGYVAPLADGEHFLIEPPPAVFSPWKLIAVLATGGFLSGVLVNALAPEAEGHGTDAVIEAYHFKRGFIRPIVPLVKLVASALTIGCGGSGGREGPIRRRVWFVPRNHAKAAEPRP